MTAGTKSYTYDSNGNCTKVTVGTSFTTLTYDDSNRVTGITYPGGGTNSFVYNGEDLRVSKTDSAGTSAVTTDGATPASPVLKDSRAVYTPGLSEHAGSASKFYHGDALGSTRGITDASQATTDAVLYDAFGMTVSRTGTTAAPFGFVGAQQYQTDADSGLQLLGHRYYDASVGRFISSDPAKAGTNWYAYTENRPLRATDKSGLFALAALLPALAIPGVGEAVAVGLIGAAIIGGIIWWGGHYYQPSSPPVYAPTPAPAPAPQPEPEPEGPTFDPTPPGIDRPGDRFYHYTVDDPSNWDRLGDRQHATDVGDLDPVAAKNHFRLHNKPIYQIILEPAPWDHRIVITPGYPPFLPGDWMFPGGTSPGTIVGRKKWTGGSWVSF